MSLNNVLDTIAATQSGAWTVTANAGTGFPAVATAGSAVPATGLMAYGSDGTNARALSVTAGGVLNVAFSGSATPADNAANPTTAALSQAFNMLYDGATWDMARGTSVGGAFQQGPVAHDGVAAGNPLIVGGVASTSAPTAVAVGDAVNVWVNTQGVVQVGDGGGSLTVDGTVSVSGTVTVDTEMPAAAALADATANPTTSSLGALNMLYNGTTWDRVRGDTTNGIDVDVTRVTGTVTISGTVTANAGTGFPTVATHGSAHITTGLQTMLTDGTNAIRAKANANGSAFTTGDVTATLAAMSTISVTTTRTLLLASNTARRGFIICNNTSGADIYVGNVTVIKGDTAIAAGGPRVSKNGGALTFSQMYGYTGAVHGVTASGTAIVAALEW